QTEVGSLAEWVPEPEGQEKLHSIIRENVGEARSYVEGELEEDVLTEEGRKMKSYRDRKQRHKDAIHRRYSFGTPPAVVLSEMDEMAEMEDQEMYNEDGREESSSSDNDEYPDDEGAVGGIFGALHKFSSRGDHDIFYKDPIYDDYEQFSITSIKSVRSTRVDTVDTIQLKQDFLSNFEMPSLSDISEEHEPEEPKGLMTEPSVAAMDEGIYVDPLTAAPLSKSSSSEVVSLLGIEDQDDSPGLASPHEPSDGSEISDIPDILDFPDTAPKKVTITFEELPRSIAMVQSQEVLETEEKASKKDVWVDTMVRDFMEDLLKELVETYESHRLDVKLRMRCDKKKLYAELCRITDTYLLEKQLNIMLCNRVSDYHRRVRNIRVFTQLNEEEQIPFYHRYKEALAKLDLLLLSVSMGKYKYAEQVKKLIMELDATKEVTYFTESRLEHKMYKYLIRPDSVFMKRHVDLVLRQMNAKRNEISDMRFRVVSKKQALGTLVAKIKELDTLSSTVSIMDFLAIQNDVINLSKKIEERNMELNKMRTQYLTDVHLTYHKREKALALSDKLNQLKIMLKKSMSRQRSLRSILFNQKLKRTRMREQRKDLTFQGGILAMPSLMYEYDNTVMQIKDSQERVAKLRDTLKTLSRRVSEIAECKDT
ncbi:hypothetical protein KR054_008678, partial [Drosophila jambulina]